MRVRHFTDEGQYREVDAQDVNSLYCKPSPLSNVLYVVNPTRLTLRPYGSEVINTRIGLPRGWGHSMTSVITKGDLGNDVFVLVADNRSQPDYPITVTLRNLSSSTRSIEALTPIAAILDVTCLTSTQCHPSSVNISPQPPRTPTCECV